MRLSIEIAQSFVQTKKQMSRAQKALDKIMSGQSDKNVSFDEAAYVLTRAGFALDHIVGSHHVFRHSDGRRIVLPLHGKHIKPPYVRQIRELLKS